MPLHALLVGGVVDNAKAHKYGEKYVQKAVYGFGDVDVGKFFHAKYDQRGNGSPESPGFKTILHNKIPP
jgi:hypothetical protein